MNNLILALFQSGDKLKLSSVCHLLNGKRTASVLIFGFFQENLSFFGLFPNLKQEELRRACEQLVREGLLEGDGIMYALSNKGKAVISSAPKVYDLDGVSYSRTAAPFFELLLFATQVVSYASYKERDYLPIDSNNFHHYQVKRWYVGHKCEDAFVESFYNEWQALILTFPEDLRDGIVSLLSGYSQVGQTFEQVFGRSNLTNVERYLEKTGLEQAVIKEIEQSVELYPLFNSLRAILLESAGNHSAAETYRLSKQGYSVEEIMRKRNLKESTVVDHIIEGLILDNNPNYSFYLTESDCNFFDKYYCDNDALKTWKYREIVQNSAYSFLAFRAYQIMKEKEVRGSGD